MAISTNSQVVEYYEKNLTLAKTLTIVMSDAAELMNQHVLDVHGEGTFDPYDKTTWKYYQNLAGQYHNTDTVIQIVSIDSLDTIDFTRENLAIHTATRDAYSFGTRQYFSLMDRYPDHHLLIRGILTPADLQTAIESEDGTIVAYPLSLVESNEATLIFDLERYIKRIIKRWYNRQFIMSDNLYLTSFLTRLQMMLLPALLNLRTARCMTAEAHSFHVRMHLASHQGLDRYLPYLTLEQSLWLYRNIRYLERNVGKEEQFLILIDKLLSARGIPLARYSVEHQSEFEHYQPNIISRLQGLNDQSAMAALPRQPIETLFNNERLIEPGNDQYLQAHQNEATQNLKLTPSSQIPTKVLNSTMVDYTNAIPEPFEIIALRQWCYMSTHDLYNVLVTFKDPRTSQPYTVQAKDAFIYLWYITLEAEGIKITDFPEYLNMRQRRHPKPSLDDLLSVVDKRFDLESLVQTILSRQPIIQKSLSVTHFRDQVQVLADEAYWHWFLVASIAHPYVRGMVENVIHRLYEDERVKFEMNGLSFQDWLTLNSLPVFNFTRDEAQLLIKSIFEAGTGLIIDETRRLSNIQRAMVDLMKELSSYNIQFIREINEDDIILIDEPVIRVVMEDFSTQETIFIRSSTNILEARYRYRQVASIGISVDTWVAHGPCTQCSRTAVVISPEVSTVVSYDQFSLHPDHGGADYIDITYPGQDEALEEEIGIPFYTLFDQMSLSEQRQLKSKYRN